MYLSVHRQKIRTWNITTTKIAGVLVNIYGLNLMMLYAKGIAVKNMTKRELLIKNNLKTRAKMYQINAN